jgi:hypothetical protein
MIELPERDPDDLEALAIQEMFDELAMRRCHEAMDATEARRESDMTAYMPSWRSPSTALTGSFSTPYVRHSDPAGSDR